MNYFILDSFVANHEVIKWAEKRGWTVYPQIIWAKSLSNFLVQFTSAVELNDLLDKI